MTFVYDTETEAQEAIATEGLCKNNRVHKVDDPNTGRSWFVIATSTDIAVGRYAKDKLCCRAYIASPKRIKLPPSGRLVRDLGKLSKKFDGVDDPVVKALLSRLNQLAAPAVPENQEGSNG